MISAVSISAPKTGSHLLGFGLGLPTLSVYYVKSVGSYGVIRTDDEQVDFLKECTPPAFWAHVTHSAQMESYLKENYKAVFFIARDPRDVVVSHSHYITKLETASVNYVLPDGSCLNHYNHSERMRFLLRILGQELRKYSGWFNGHTYIVRYENMVHNRLGEFQKIHDFLVSLGEEPHSASEMVQKSFKKHSISWRKGDTGDWKEEFSDTHLRLAKHHLTQVMEEWGYSW